MKRKMPKVMKRKMPNRADELAARAEESRLLLERTRADELAARAEESERIVEAARGVLARVAESMPEHTYQELASALEAPPRFVGGGDGAVTQLLSRLDEWSLTFGADLCPGSRPDTFGEGMRAAKDRVRDLLLGRAGPGVRR